MSNKERVEWIDCAKGIAIILVIIGHTVSYGKYGSNLRGMIFSFHMPLFFILSCTTFKCSNDLKQYKFKVQHASKHLIIPVAVVFGLEILIELIKNIYLIFDIDFWKQELYCWIFSCGVDTQFNGFTVKGIGIPWFFFALFIGRSIFDYLHLAFEEKKLSVIVWLCCGIGIAFGSIQWLPFSMDIALAIMPFFYYGYRLKKKDMFKSATKNMAIWGITWIVSLLITFPDYNNWTYLELATRRYNLFPICYLTAISGTMFVSEFSVVVTNKIKRIIKPVVYFGRNSLYLLCVHIMDYNWYNLWNVEGHQFYSAIKRTILDLLFFIILMYGIKLVKIMTKSGRK